MRFRLIVSSLALTLAGCSQPKDQGTEPAASPAPATAASPVASPGPSEPASVSPTPSPSASASPVPAPSPSTGPSPAVKPAAAPPAPAATVAAAPPPSTWARCAVCHNVEKGAEDKLGPNLFGVYGTKAAVGGFAFSPALKGAGLTWNDANLDKWIEAPMTMVPGTQMAFPGIKDPAKRAALVEYLKSKR